MTGVVPYTTYYAKEDYINNNKDIIKKFNTALNKGLTFVKNNEPSEIAKVILPEFPDLSLNDLTNLIKRYKDADSWYDNTFVNIDDYNRLVDIMIYGEALSKKLPVEVLITNEFN